MMTTSGNPWKLEIGNFPLSSINKSNKLSFYKSDLTCPQLHSNNPLSSTEAQLENRLIFHWTKSLTLWGRMRAVWSIINKIVKEISAHIDGPLSPGRAPLTAPIKHSWSISILATLRKIVQIIYKTVATKSPSQQPNLALLRFVTDHND